MSAMLAMVLPSLKLFVSITLNPFSTGTSNTIPDTVLIISVFEVLPDFLDTPSFTIANASSAAFSSSIACFRASSKGWNSA